MLSKTNKTDKVGEMDKFIKSVWGDLAPMAGEETSTGKRQNSAAVLTPFERAALERIAKASGMSYSEVLRAGFRRLMRSASEGGLLSEKA